MKKVIAVTFNTPTPEFSCDAPSEVIGQSAVHSVYKFEVHDSQIEQYRDRLNRDPQVQMFSVSTRQEWNQLMARHEALMKSTKPKFSGR